MSPLSKAGHFDQPHSSDDKKPKKSKLKATIHFEPCCAVMEDILRITQTFDASAPCEYIRYMPGPELVVKMANDVYLRINYCPQCGARVDLTIKAPSP